MKHVLTAQISPERFFLVGRIHRAQVIQTDSSPVSRWKLVVNTQSYFIAYYCWTHDDQPIDTNQSILCLLVIL